MTAGLWETVQAKLEKGWSLEQIAGQFRMKPRPIAVGIGKGRRGAVISLVDRASKPGLLARVKRKTAEAVDKRMVRLRSSIRHAPAPLGGSNQVQMAT